MEVRPEIRTTSVGMIPEGWEGRSVFDLADHQKARFDDGDWVEAEHITDEGIRLVQTGNIGIGCFVEKDSKKYIFQRSFEKLNCKELIPGDLLICRLAEPAGRACIFPDIGEKKAITSVDVTIFRPRVESIDRRYLVQYFSTKAWFDSVQESVGGTTHKRISRSALGKIQVPVPASIEEQRAIATALSDVDALIAGLEKLIAKKRDIKQAAMQQLLTGQTRLPGFSGKWETKRLGQSGRCLRGVSYQGDSDLSSHDTESTKRLLRSNNVQNSTVITDDVQFVNSARVAESQLLRVNDILVCMANGSKALVGKAGLFSVSDGYDYTFGAFMGCFRVEEKLADPRFVFALFQTGKYKDYINNLLAGSSINNLRPSSIESLEFQFPPMPEQLAIAHALSDMDSELQNLESRLTKTQAIKQGMMQELLTGRTRLI